MGRKIIGRYLVSDPSVCYGRLTFRNTHILVIDVLNQVANGITWDVIIGNSHQSISKEAIAEVVRLAGIALTDHADDYIVETISV